VRRMDHGRIAVPDDGVLPIGGYYIRSRNDQRTRPLAGGAASAGTTRLPA